MFRVKRNEDGFKPDMSSTLSGSVSCVHMRSIAMSHSNRKGLDPHQLNHDKWYQDAEEIGRLDGTLEEATEQGPISVI